MCLYVSPKKKPPRQTLVAVSYLLLTNIFSKKKNNVYLTYNVYKVYRVIKSKIV